jgi:Xaa-Pro aminopeptidase
VSRFLDPGPVSRTLGDAAETRVKLTQLREAMAVAGIDAVHLERWANVAWLCGGRGNRVVLDSELGLCAVLVTEDGAWLLAPNNEEGRLRAEVFADLPLPLIVRAWYQMPLWQATAGRLPEGAGWASDVPAPGAVDAEALVAPLRRRLDEAEIARYRGLGLDAAEGLETALLEARPGWSELEVAGTVAAALKARDIEPAVVLVGTRARAERFRHLVPTNGVVEGGLVASVTAVRHGLHASMTRSLSFGDLPALLAERHDAVVSVDRAYLECSVSGRTLGEAFQAGEEAYEAAGYYDEWQEHHQGGTTGYAGREVFAMQRSDHEVTPGTALAWNPTVPGAKSEDTVIVRAEGLELLTGALLSPWPMLDGGADQPLLPRPGVLIV